MRNVAHLRKKSWYSAFIAVATLLAAVMAPVCTPFCNAHTCIKAGTESTAEESCHHAAARNKNAPELQAVQNCAAANLPLGTLDPAKRGPELQMVRSAAYATSPYLVAQAQPAILISLGTRCRLCAGQLCSGDLFLTRTVLRI
jgi:hypothetical protein